MNSNTKLWNAVLNTLLKDIIGVNDANCIDAVYSMSNGYFIDICHRADVAPEKYREGFEKIAPSLARKRTDDAQTIIWDNIGNLMPRIEYIRSKISVSDIILKVSRSIKRNK